MFGAKTRSTIAAVAALLAAAPLAGQGLVEAPEWDRPKTRILVGISGVGALPVGEFRNFVDAGGGLDLNTVFNFDQEGIVGLRLEGSVLWYGSERIRGTFGSVFPRVGIDVRTDNLIAAFGGGPQLTLGNGPIRPYLFGTVGFSYFATVSSVEGDFDDVFTTTNFDDVTFAANAGGGFLLRVSGGRTPVYIDLGATAVHNGEARYLREGSIVDLPDGSIAFTPIRSEANLVTFRLGVTFGVL